MGISIFDSLILWPINIIVEGLSDQIIIEDAKKKLKNEKMITFNFDVNDIRIHPAKSAVSACYTYERYISEIDNNSIKCKLILDGDDAGGKALRGLQ
ncbi:hypothetical protein [Breznakiella homolactica]|uniref:Uncharacterized protein n=1 Tax=Breznakiella homolactica TaxID=2798577 RepID=A0A7T7XQ02_9SPIR|nr:hypothetical protein [Breznakiella homolactica]QQO10380.1 hypothetical protein JFL75_05530 [Breznakiella homolactica]